MANDSVSEVNDPAGDTGLYGSANECLAIKSDTPPLSLQDASRERLTQAQAVIQMIQMFADGAQEGGFPSKAVIANASWAAVELLEQAGQFLAELNTKIDTDPGRPCPSGHAPREGMKAKRVQSRAAE